MFIDTDANLKKPLREERNVGYLRSTLHCALNGADGKGEGVDNYKHSVPNGTDRVKRDEFNCDPGTNRQRAFSKCDGSPCAIYAADLADAPGGPLSQTLSGAAREIFIHGFVQAT